MKKILIAIFGFLVLSHSFVTADTTVRWWQFWTDPTIRPLIDSLVTEFEAAHPGIDIERTDLTWANGHEKIVIAFASGTGPDVVELGSDWIAQFAANGQLADVTARADSIRNEFDGWGMATYDSSVWAMPWILGTRLLFINRDLTASVGLTEKWLPTRLGQMGMAIVRIDTMYRNEGVRGWGSNTAEKHRLYKKFLPFFWSHGAQIFTDDGKYCVISSTMAVEALTKYKQLHDDYSFVGTQREIEDAFLDGKVGFIISGDWLLKRITKERPGFNFSTTLFPGLHLPGRSFLGGEFLAVNAESTVKDEAWQFVRFLTLPVNQLRFCKANNSANPSSKEAQQEPYFQDDPNLQTFVGQLRLAKHPPVDPDWVYIEEIIERAVEDVLFNDAPLAHMLRNAQLEITMLKRR